MQIDISQFLGNSCTVTLALQGVSDDPVLSRLSTTTTSRDFISPPDHFPKRVPYRLPSPSSQPKRTRGRDSSRDTKPVPHRSSIMVEEGNKPYGTPLPPSSLPTTGVPKLPAIPRPFVPRPRSEYAHLPLMHQRGPDGKMLGGATRRYVPAEYVPYREPAAETEVQHQQGYAHAQEAEAGTGDYGEYALQEYVAGEDMQQVALVDDSPVGPDNPMKTLSATWSACWDDEAGAVYYYNHTSGEATWVLPDDLE